MGDLICKRGKAASRRAFVLSTGVKNLELITGRELPAPGEVFKFLSIHGGVASLTFIKWVADHEPILRLQASTLRIGPKQYRYLDQMAKSGRLKSARFITSAMQKDVDRAGKGPNYAKEFSRTADRNGWDVAFVNNHSKIILMQTASAWYVLETSSNLNENPKIEHCSFENNQELYEFYSDFFDRLCEQEETKKG